MMRDSLIFYQSFAKAIKRLPEEDQLRALWSIIDYGLDGTEPEGDGLFMVAFEMAKPQIDANVKRKVDGSKGGRPKTTGYCKTETTGYENEKPKEKEKVKEKVKEKDDIKTICPEPGKSSAPDSPIAGSFILNDGSMYNVTENDVVYYQQLYPGIDCVQELRKMAGWCDSNQKYRKTRSGAKRFMNSWFARAQDDASKRANGKAAGKKNTFMNFEERKTDYDTMVTDMARAMVAQS